MRSPTTQVLKHAADCIIIAAPSEASIIGSTNTPGLTIGVNPVRPTELLILDSVNEACYSGPYEGNHLIALRCIG
jgi:hypothetical protein